MKLKTQTPKQSLNKAFLKQPVARDEIESFKANLQTLLSKINENESEEHHKNFVRDFLKDTFYKADYEINTKGRQDLVIHVGKDASENVGVILETKKPTNKADMISADNPNKKALHELVLYFLRERIDENNIDVKYLIVTNINEWFIFDSSVFNRLFYENKSFVKDYKEWRDKQKITGNTDLFYNEIAKHFIETINEETACTYFDIRDYETALKNDDLQDDESLIELFKILSQNHLLKVPFADDSNKLDKNFYTELLHIVGLEEIKDKSKLRIDRKAKEKRDAGSLIENAITIIITEDLLPNVKNIESYGETREDRLFNVALDLCLTWINRVLFLKLLEAQLVDYHNGNRAFRFLDTDTIKDFDGLYRLFHQVLAINLDERISQVKEKFRRVPYLNSSLFEFTDLEKQTLKINSLNDTETLNLINTTVLKEIKKQNGELPTLEYLFKFLDAYDFASEGREGIAENNRTLINASVLGKVFEKINGYKDGSIYTPGFITMYMCRQAIRLAVVQKFKDAYGWNIAEFADIKNYLFDRRSKADILEFNALVNSLHLCDPAVGSGHFLVSSLNEIIAIKSELGILADANGERFRDFEITIENDELTVFDTDKSEFFKYRIADGKPNSKEAHRLQKTLFHEKQTLIENCLFGVDINPNSVKICRLRLWIELLKNAYYKESANFAELETLPNIDINIKEGNSLVSRFALDEDLKKVLKTVKYSIEDYRNFVLGYKETRNREVKRDFENKIKQIKEDFRVELNHFSPVRIKLAKIENELFEKQSKQFLFGEDEDKQKERLKRIEELKFDVDEQKQKVKETEENAIYKNAFEWRFEFPEVLDDDGNFTGFDIVIGNPPYGSLVSNNLKPYIKEKFISVEGAYEIYKFFIEFGLNILKENYILSFITPDTWTNLSYFKNLRLHIFGNYQTLLFSKTLYDVFDEAIVDTILFLIRKNQLNNDFQEFIMVDSALTKSENGKLKQIENDAVFQFKKDNAIVNKIETNTILLDEIVEIWRGMSAYGAKNPDKPYNSIVKETDFHRKLLNGGNIGKYTIDWANEYIKYGNWLHRPRPSYIYDKPHLLIQRIRNPRLKQRIIATIDFEQFISSDGLSNILLKTDEFDLKFILSIVNSNLINYWFSYHFFDVNIKPEQLRKIPIKKIEEKDQQPFVALVDRILELKKEGKDTQALEDKIDALVYQLYELTAEEIAIVEGRG